MQASVVTALRLSHRSTWDKTGVLARSNQADTKEGTGGGGEDGMGGPGCLGLQCSRGTHLQLGPKTVWPFGSTPDYDERETHGHRGHMSENENPLIATTLGPPTRKPWRLKS